MVSHFIELFEGLPEAFGTGRGEWVRRPLHAEDVVAHLAGAGPGIGVAPLCRDGSVRFAAIDLDEPDFKAAREMQELLPGTTWLERSRSGNAHVWAFFTEPVEAWVPRGLMREAAAAAGKPRVEVFPKQTALLPDMLGSYINLPYHGEERPIISAGGTPVADGVAGWVPVALAARNTPDSWRKRARFMGLAAPEERERSSEFGEAAVLHRCAEKIIAEREVNPVTAGHRSVVYFSVAKQLLNWRDLDDDEAWELLVELESCSPDRVSERELRRIFNNARTRNFTSTGCDEPQMAPYIHPDCPIARNL